MAALGSEAFAVQGVPITEDVAVVEVGLDVNLTSILKFGVPYSDGLGNDASDQGVKGNFVWLL